MSKKKLRDIVIPLVILLSLVFNSCKTENSFKDDFNNQNNRVWIGQDYWSIPLEDWRINDGRMECVGNRSNMRVNILTQTLSGEGDLKLSMRLGLLKEGKTEGTAGFSLGLKDDTDNDVRSVCYFGTGIDLGISTEGFLFIGQSIKDLPSEFDFKDVTLSLYTNNEEDKNKLELVAKDLKGKTCSLSVTKDTDLKGLIAIANNHQVNSRNGSTFWFDDLSISGSMLEVHPENSFGPVLWTMYTLSEGVMKMTAQMPPLGTDDEQAMQLQIKADDQWKTIATEKIDAAARTCRFRIENWDASKDHDYRVVYVERFQDGTNQENFYSGVIRHDPVDKELSMGALTCQYHYGFPYRPLSENLQEKNPDMLFFSGDQIYEPNGGYGIIRFPADRAILNYLGKWYMFGWAFGDLMRDRPTICLPDDHEVFQGNLWGNAGKKVTQKEWRKTMDATSGFVEPAEMVNVVMRTNTSHLPDPYDPTPIKQGIDVYYTDLVYGRVSFALVGDRIFKSGPEQVKDITRGLHWGRRIDMLTKPYPRSKKEQERELKLLGDRQMKFLNHWVRDWKGADMKVLLSQTIFANNVTHYGPKKELLGADLDSGGWPKSGRDKVVDLMRKCFAFHICGDQHLPSMIQYGIDDYKDGSWAFCTPAIAVGYQRRFLPDRIDKPVKDRPMHNLPNTGCYEDGLGNKNFVYAVGNPEDNTTDLNRYQKAQKCASGFGYITFEQTNRNITADAYRFLSKEDDEKSRSNFEGWPKTINQIDNYNHKYFKSLPTIMVTGIKNPVVEVINEKTNKLENIVRINGDSYQPKVSRNGTFTIRVFDPENGKQKTIENIAALNDNSKTIKIKF